MIAGIRKSIHRFLDNKAVSMPFWAVPLFVILLLCSFAPGCAKSQPSGGVVVFVADGDTVILDSGEKVRYLGIDAPEIGHEGNPSDCHGDEVREANAGWVLHKKVSLRYGKETRDHYGRLLAYVFLPDGKCVNALMIQSGYAWLFRPALGFDRFKEFLAYQREAIRERRGLWGSCKVEAESRYEGNKLSYILHRPQCPLGHEMSPRHRRHFQNRWAALEQGYRPCRQCKP